MQVDVGSGPSLVTLDKLVNFLPLSFFLLNNGFTEI